MNKKYIKILEVQDYIYKNGAFVDVAPYKKERLGSDSTVIVDQRLNVNSIIEQGFNYIERRGFKFFEIRQGNLDSFRVLYTNY